MSVEVSLVAAYNDKGELLLGKRNDNKLWSLAGGHIEPGEDPKAAAARELHEETGLTATSLSFITEYTGTNGVHLHCFSAYVHGEPHSEIDPDNEISKWVWVDVSEGLPSKYYNHMVGPDPKDGDNFVARLFDLQKKEDSTAAQSTDSTPESTDLAKMAIRDIPKGTQLAPSEEGEIPIFNYDHVLTPQHRADGYHLHLYDTPGQGYEAILRQDGGARSAGAVAADFQYLHDTEHPAGISVHSNLDAIHRGKGLGKAMYEAVYAHAMHNGIKRVFGHEHSHEAGAVHEKLSQKHGMNYSGQPPAKGSGFDRGHYGYALKSEESPTDLIKMRTPPLFPGLGVPDNRREIPIITTPEQLKSKQLGMRAAVSIKHPAAVETKERALNDPSMGMVSTIPGSRIGFARGTALRQETASKYPLAAIDYLNNNADLSTQQHENFHMMMNRIEELHGTDARKQTAKMLLTNIPDADRRTVIQHSAGHNMSPSNPRYDEESLALLHNYLNNPGKRQAFHTSAKHTPEFAREFGNSMKRAHRFVSALAPRITPLDVVDAVPDEPVSKGENYRGEHEAPQRGEGAAPLHDLKGVYPEDFYSPNANQLYSSGEPYDHESLHVIRALRNRPNAQVRIYRALPYTPSSSEQLADINNHKRYVLKHGAIPPQPLKLGFNNSSHYYDWLHGEQERLKAVPDTGPSAAPQINPGDWVSVNRKYAMAHAKSLSGGVGKKYKTISKLVPARHVYTDGNSLHEQGYDPSGDPVAKGEPPGLDIPNQDQVGPTEPPGLDKQSINYTCPHGLQVFLVSGEFCRNHYDSDMVQGANPFRYKWVPKTEIWVDNDTPRAEIPYVIQHECNESERMRGGESYEQAHDQAKGIEDRERHREDPGELGKAEELAKMALIHDDRQNPATVYRVENHKGEGPYTRYGMEAVLRAATKKWDPTKQSNSQPSLGGDFPQGDLDAFNGSSIHKFGFEKPEHASDWFGPENLKTLHNYGYELKPVKASRVYRSNSGKQVFFLPHGSTTLANPIEKAESEVDRLLNHPDPIERRMALRLDSTTTPNVDQAALDQDPQVHEAAIDHPLFGEIEGHNLLSAKEGSDGQYPVQQQLAFLSRTHRVTPGHINTAVLTATDAPSDARDAILNAVVKHPSLSPANVRTIYRGYGATHTQRYALMDHPAVPQDVLEHAIEGAMLFPSEHSQSLAMKAAGHKNLAPEAREALVRKVGDNSPPHVVQLAANALFAGPVSPELGEDLHMQRMLRPSSPYVHQLMGAYLKGPSATGEDLGRALRIQHPDVIAGAMDHKDFGNRHLQMLMPAPSVSPEIQPIAKSESHERSSISSLVNEPIVKLQHGIDLSIKPCFQAARFLSGGAEVDLGAMRRALYVEDGNIEAAALRAYGFTVNDDNLKALKAIQDLKELGKAEDDGECNAQEITNPQSHGEVSPNGEVYGDDVCQAVARAFENKFVFRVKLGGKHSAGSMLAHDSETGTWLLKSGSGGAGAAAGASQDPSEPNAREAAWWHIAECWGVSEYYPRAELVNIDGQNYAAMLLLPLSYRSLEDLRQADSGEPRRILEPYLRDGSLHRWAALDLMLGNADSHLGNVLTEGAKPDQTERHRHQDEPRVQLTPEKQPVTLIDHGSAFAGPAFDPAHDQASFVPGYLRAWALNMNYNTLPPDEKLRHLPRVDRKTDLELKVWFDGLDLKKMTEICTRYGINPEPQLNRIAKLRRLCGTTGFCEAVNRMWVTV